MNDGKPARSQGRMKIQPPDGGWGWAIIVATCISMMVIPTTVTCFGVLVPAIVQDLDSTIAQVSIIPAIAGAVWNLTAPWASAMLTLYSHRRLAFVGTMFVFGGILLSSLAPSVSFMYLTYGVMSGFGCGIASGMGLLIVQEYFVKKRALANGLTMAGGSVGQMAIPLLLQLFLQDYGIRGGLLLYSGLVLNGVIAAVLLQPSRWHWTLCDGNELLVDQKLISEPDAASYVTSSGSRACLASVEPLQVMQQFHTLQQLRQQLKTHQATPRNWYLRWFPRCPQPSSILDLQLFKDPFFVICSVSMAITRLTYQEVNVLVPSFAQDLGITATASASLVTILASADTVARLFVPILSDRVTPIISRLHVYLINLLLCAAGSFTMAMSTAFIGLAAGCVTYGIGIGGMTGLSLIIIVEQLGLDKLASGFGLNIFMTGFFTFPGILVIGYVQGVTGSFAICFHIIGALCLTSSALWSTLPIISRRQKECQKQSQANPS